MKEVLGLLENTLLDLSSLGQQGEATPRSGGGNAPRGISRNVGGYAASEAGVPVGAAAAGGVLGEVALPAWQQVLDRVKSLSRWVRGGALWSTFVMRPACLFCVLGGMGGVRAN